MPFQMGDCPQKNDQKSKPFDSTPRSADSRIPNPFNAISKNHPCLPTPRLFTFTYIRIIVSSMDAVASIASWPDARNCKCRQSR